MSQVNQQQQYTGSKGKSLRIRSPLFSQPQVPVPLWAHRLLDQWSGQSIRIDEHVPAWLGPRQRQHSTSEGKAEQPLRDHPRSPGEPQHSQEGDADPQGRERDTRVSPDHEAEWYTQGTHQRAASRWGGDQKALREPEGRDIETTDTGHVAQERENCPREGYS